MNRTIVLRQVKMIAEAPAASLEEQVALGVTHQRPGQAMASATLSFQGCSRAPWRGSRGAILRRSPTSRGHRTSGPSAMSSSARQRMASICGAVSAFQGRGEGVPLLRRDAVAGIRRREIVEGRRWRSARPAVSRTPAARGAEHAAEPDSHQRNALGSTLGCFSAK